VFARAETSLASAASRAWPVLVTRRNELAEERVRLKGLGLELGVELAAQEVGMAGQLDDLDIGRVGVAPLMRSPAPVSSFSYSRLNS